jgi:IS30 family transposase
MTYTQITSAERYAISLLRKHGHSQAEIALLLGRHRSTVSRELRRNICREDSRSYVWKRAHSYACGRRSRSRRNTQFSTEDWATIESALREDFSPEQVAGWFQRFDIVPVSHETIYRHIWKDKARGGTLHTHLRCATKQKRKRYGAYDSRGRLAGKRPLSARPAGATNRSALGHWEIDTVLGNSQGGACIMTLVERVTGFLVIGKLERRASADLNARLEALIRRERRPVRTITADNGTEFHSYKAVERRLPVKFYFAAPHRSWERGSNENINGLIRQYLPKGVSMEHLTQADCDRIADKLNNRPRKRYNWHTPEELYAA